MTTFVRAYLRASTNDQDARRAQHTLDTFAHERGVVICGYYAENESGARLDRPALFRLLADCRPHDVLLVEDVDRLSRLAAQEWKKCKRSNNDAPQGSVRAGILHGVSAA
nr:recombinase family protein [Pandoraea faecigallinarum]